jgi:uncharacterized protein (TIGR01777 family)
MAKNILITGASGLVGTRLTEILLQRGHRVCHVGRSKKNNAVQVYVWDIALGIVDPRAIAATDVIIHLAGANVAESRWTEKRKDEILQSRIKSTALLFNTLKKGNYPVKTFISASATGYYGFGEDEIFTELSPPGKDFLAQVTEQWEAEVNRISSLGLRCVKLRTGIVLSASGGALRSIAAPVKWGLGAALGTGNQYISWIHLDDLCNMYCKAVEDNTMEGTFNAVSDHPVTNREMTQAIGKVLKRPLWLPSVPGFVLKLMLGEMAEMVVRGNKVSAQKIITAGFTFQFPELEPALRDIYKK